MIFSGMKGTKGSDFSTQLSQGNLSLTEKVEQRLTVIEPVLYKFLQTIQVAGSAACTVEYFELEVFSFLLWCVLYHKRVHAKSC